MPAKVSLIVVSLAIVLLPWLLWRIGAVQRIAPLAVVQIMVGVALGPSGFGQVAPEWSSAILTRPVLGALDGVASLGVLLYVLVTGLHLDLALLRRDAPRLGAVALGSVVVPLALGVAVGMVVLARMPEAVGASGSTWGLVAAIGLCTAVTALPVLAAVLQELGLIGTRLGQTALALSALDDAALWIMLAVLLALTGSAAPGGALLQLGLAMLWFSALLAIVRPWLARQAQPGERAMLAIAIALTLASAGISEALGTGSLIGAFAVGAVLPSAWRAPLRERLELVTSVVLLPFFFMTTGLKALIEPGSSSFLGLLALLLAATIAGKVAGTTPLAGRLGFSRAEGFALGVMMQTKGLMEVVVLAVLNDAGLIGRQVFSAMVAMAVICTLITAPAVRLCLGRDARYLEQEMEAEPAD